MAKYKVIDGVLYAEVSSSEIQQKLNTAVERVRPYKEGIAQCEQQISAYENQIKEYKSQISSIIAESGIDREAAALVDPEKTSFLGL